MADLEQLRQEAENLRKKIRVSRLKEGGRQDRVGHALRGVYSFPPHAMIWQSWLYLRGRV